MKRTKKITALALTAVLMLAGCNSANVPTSSDETASSELTSTSSKIEEVSGTEATSSIEASSDDNSVSSDVSSSEDISSEDISSEDIDDGYTGGYVTDIPYCETAFEYEGVKIKEVDGKKFTVGYEGNGVKILDNVLLPELNPEYPGGAAIASLTSLAYYYGFNDITTFEELYETIPTSCDFYYENGQLYGPHPIECYIGDFKDATKKTYGAAREVFVESVNEILKKNNIKFKMPYTVVHTLLKYHDKEEFKDYSEWHEALCKTINDGKIYFINSCENKQPVICNWKNKTSVGDLIVETYENIEYGIIIGHNNDYIVVFHPQTQKIVSYCQCEKKLPILFLLELEKI